MRRTGRGSNAAPKSRMSRATLCSARKSATARAKYRDNAAARESVGIEHDATRRLERRLQNLLVFFASPRERGAKTLGRVVRQAWRIRRVIHRGISERAAASVQPRALISATRVSH